MKPIYHQAIRKLAPNLSFKIKGDNYDTLISINGESVPTEADIQAKVTELKNAEPMRLLRLERDRKLSETDWWCCSDRTPTQAQLDYRTALRDLPSTASPSLNEDGQLTGVTWPTKPEKKSCLQIYKYQTSVT